MQEGRTEKALAGLLRAKALAPEDAEIQFEFAMVALRLSLHEDAATALTLALRQKPRAPRYLYGMARTKLLLGELPEAEQLFREYVTLRPDDASGFYGLGRVLAMQRKAGEAAESFRRSVALQPEQTEAPYQLGLIALAEREMEEAASWFARVLARAPRHAAALSGRGQVEFSRGQHAAARQSLEAAIAVDTTLAKAHYTLSRTLLALGEREAAAREAETASRLEQEQKQQRRVMLRLAEEPQR